MKLPKVLIFTPIYEAKDYSLEEFLKHTEALTYPNKRHIFIDNSETDEYYHKLKKRGLDVYYVGRGNNSREAISRGQNFARKIALEENYPYIFSLESDIMCPPDIVQRLMSRGKDVISGLYHIGDRSKGVRVPCITIKKWNENLAAFGTRLLNPEEWDDYNNKGVKQVQAAGMGCCLIHKNAFKRVAFTYDPRLKGHSDIYFFNDMFRMRIPVYVDTDVYCDHQNVNWTTVEDR